MNSNNDYSNYKGREPETVGNAKLERYLTNKEANIFTDAHRITDVHGNVIYVDSQFFVDLICLLKKERMHREVDELTNNQVLLAFVHAPPRT